ncbi:MAG: hypothetical protein ACKVOJ_01455 [Sphingomonadaceae bacterium]
MDTQSLTDCLALLKQADTILLQDSKDIGHAAHLSALIEGLLSDYGIESDPSFYGEEA